VLRAISISSEIKRLKLKQQQQKLSSSPSPRPPRASPNSSKDDEIMTFIDYPGRERRHSNAKEDKVPPTRIKIYLSRITLEEFVPKRPDSADSHGEAGKENQRGGSGSSPGPSVLSKLQIGRPGNTLKPPLPPKTDAHRDDTREDGSKKKSFWARAMS